MTTLRTREDASGVAPGVGPGYPTMDDLPSEFPGEEALPNEFHALFAILLMETFFPKTFPIDRVFSVLDMYLYFQHQGKTRGFRPDWFGAVDVPALYEGTRMRQSYVVSAEGKPPFIIVEALSKSTDTSSLLTLTRSLTAFRGFITAFTGFINPFTTSINRFRSSLNRFSTSLKRFTSSLNPFTCSLNRFTGFLNRFRPSLNRFMKHK